MKVEMEMLSTLMQIYVTRLQGYGKQIRVTAILALKLGIMFKCW